MYKISTWEVCVNGKHPWLTWLERANEMKHPRNTLDLMPCEWCGGGENDKNMISMSHLKPDVEKTKLTQ